MNKKKVFQIIILIILSLFMCKYFDLDFNLCRKILKVILSLIFISNILLCNDDYDDCNEDECSLKKLDIKNAEEFAKIQADILERIEGDQTTKIINMVYDIESDEDCIYDFTFWGIVKDISLYILKSFYHYIVKPFLYISFMYVVHELNIFFEEFFKLKGSPYERTKLLFDIFCTVSTYFIEIIYEFIFGKKE